MTDEPKLTIGVDVAKPGSDRTAVSVVGMPSGAVRYGGMIPPQFGRVVSTEVFAGRFFVTCERGVLELAGSVLVPLKFRADGDGPY